MMWKSLFILSLALILGLCSSGLLAQAPEWSWNKLQPAGSHPPARAYGTAVHDPLADRIILFGGQGSGGFLNDVWAYDIGSNNWEEVNALGTPPSPRHGHNAVYDPVGHRMVVWAGQGAGFFNDVWVLELGEMRWRRLDPGNAPEPRYGSTSVFDPASRSLVQFAGFTDSGRFNDTQSLDLQNETWTDLAPDVPIPSRRCLHTAALNPASRQMFMYGGQIAGALDDLWRFDLQANRWERLQGQGAPEGRYRTTSFFDSRGGFLVFGGRIAGGQSGELWRYDPDGNSWERIEAADGPSARHSPMGVLVAADRFYVFGGSSEGGLQNDLWQLSGPAQLIEQWLAQFANGEGFVSTILLTNPYANEQVQGRVDFFGNQGAPWSLSINGQAATESVDFAIPALGTLALETSGEGPALAGSARITSHQGVSTVLRYFFPSVGISGVAASRPAEGVISPVARSLTGRFSTGVAVVAVEGDPVLTLTLRDDQGNPVAGAVLHRSLALFSHFAEFIEQLFDQLVPDEFRGSLTITCTGGEIAATAIEFGMQPNRFTSLPISELR